jgi:hypothetical protein
MLPPILVTPSNPSKIILISFGNPLEIIHQPSTATKPINKVLLSMISRDPLISYPVPKVDIPGTLIQNIMMMGMEGMKGVKE